MKISPKCQTWVNFKERLVNVKLKDVDSWATKNMSTNWVTERTKIFRKAI